MELKTEDLPMNTQLKSEIDNEQYQYVRLRPSSIAEDVGQTTIPLLDIQPVEPIPHVPLAGVGLYHKGGLSSGFIGIKLETFNIEPYISVNPLQEEAQTTESSNYIYDNYIN